MEDTWLGLEIVEAARSKWPSDLPCTFEIVSALEHHREEDPP